MNEETSHDLINDQNNDQKLSVEAQQISFSGPLPPPQILEHYDKVVPGAAERILTMAEKQAEHRQSLEK